MRLLRHAVLTMVNFPACPSPAWRRSHVAMELIVINSTSGHAI